MGGGSRRAAADRPPLPRGFWSHGSRGQLAPGPVLALRRAPDSRASGRGGNGGRGPGAQQGAARPDRGGAGGDARAPGPAGAGGARGGAARDPRPVVAVMSYEPATVSAPSPAEL